MLTRDKDGGYRICGCRVCPVSGACSPGVSRKPGFARTKPTIPNEAKAPERTQRRNMNNSTPRGRPSKTNLENRVISERPIQRLFPADRLFLIFRNGGIWPRDHGRT